MFEPNPTLAVIQLNQLISVKTDFEGCSAHKYDLSPATASVKLLNASKNEETGVINPFLQIDKSQFLDSSFSLRISEISGNSDTVSLRLLICAQLQISIRSASKISLTFSSTPAYSKPVSDFFSISDSQKNCSLNMRLSSDKEGSKQLDSLLSTLVSINQNKLEILKHPGKNLTISFWLVGSNESPTKSIEFSVVFTVNTSPLALKFTESKPASNFTSSNPKVVEGASAGNQSDHGTNNSDFEHKKNAIVNN